MRLLVPCEANAIQHLQTFIIMSENSSGNTIANNKQTIIALREQVKILQQQCDVSTAELKLLYPLSTAEARSTGTIHEHLDYLVKENGVDDNDAVVELEEYLQCLKIQVVRNDPQNLFRILNDKAEHHEIAERIHKANLEEESYFATVMRTLFGGRDGPKFSDGEDPVLERGWYLKIPMSMGVRQLNRLRDLFPTLQKRDIMLVGKVFKQEFKLFFSNALQKLNETLLKEDKEIVRPLELDALWEMMDKTIGEDGLPQNVVDMHETFLPMFLSRRGVMEEMRVTHMEVPEMLASHEEGGCISKLRILTDTEAELYVDYECQAASLSGTKEKIERMQAQLKKLHVLYVEAQTKIPPSRWDIVRKKFTEGWFRSKSGERKRLSLAEKITRNLEKEEAEKKKKADEAVILKHGVVSIFEERAEEEEEEVKTHVDQEVEKDEKEHAASSSADEQPLLDVADPRHYIQYTELSKKFECRRFKKKRGKQVLSTKHTCIAKGGVGKDGCHLFQKIIPCLQYDMEMHCHIYDSHMNNLVDNATNTVTKQSKEDWLNSMASMNIKLDEFQIVMKQYQEQVLKIYQHLENHPKIKLETSFKQISLLNMIRTGYDCMAKQLEIAYATTNRGSYDKLRSHKIIMYEHQEVANTLILRGTFASGNQHIHEDMETEEETTVVNGFSPGKFNQAYNWISLTNEEYTTKIRNKTMPVGLYCYLSDADFEIAKKVTQLKIKFNNQISLGHCSMQTHELWQKDDRDVLKRMAESYVEIIVKGEHTFSDALLRKSGADNEPRKYLSWHSTTGRSNKTFKKTHDGQWHYLENIQGLTLQGDFVEMKQLGSGKKIQSSREKFILNFSVPTLPDGNKKVKGEWRYFAYQFKNADLLEFVEAKEEGGEKGKEGKEGEDEEEVLQNVVQVEKF